MTGKQLKNSILQWAIQGKLVPQDPNDEPASVLLERIRAEKAQLIKEGKIKKDKNESIIYRGDDNSYYEKMLATGEVKCIDEEIPFEIPQGWEWTRLGNVAELIGGYAFKSESLKGRSGTRVIRISDISESGFVNKNIVRYCGASVSDSFKIQNGDILIAMTGGTVGKSMYITNTPEALLLNQRVAAIRCSYLNTDYLDAVIKSPLVQDVVNDKKNSTNDNISMEDIYNFLIPVPPYQQQFRIILQYQKLVPFILRYKNSQEALDQLNNNISALLKKSILQEAIQGKLVLQNPSYEPASELLKHIREEKFRLVKEGKLKKKGITDSVIFRGDDNKYYEQVGDETIEIPSDVVFPEEWAILRLSDVCRLIDGEKMTGPYPCLDAKFLRGKASPTMHESGRFVKRGDNIILVDGENSGEVFMVTHDGYMGSTFKQLWISSRMYTPYVLDFILFHKDQLRNSKKGAAIPHLNKDYFYNLLIGIPPIQEQIAIHNCIEELFQKLR
jgi:type I restriction enzyme S subunit